MADGERGVGFPTDLSRRRTAISESP